MKVRLKQNLLIVTAETEEEKASLTSWGAPFDNHVFALQLQDEQTFRLTGLGPRAEACREPINVTSRSPDPEMRLISNLAHTPFYFEQGNYASVEAFWQGLKFPDEKRRQEIAGLYGQEARRAGFEAVAAERFDYHGQSIRVGTTDHWRLMALACFAKFSQHEEAKQALLSTGERPLMHKTRRDSRNIPGVIMADIWMKVRSGLVKRRNAPAEQADGDEDE